MPIDSTSMRDIYVSTKIKYRGSYCRGCEGKRKHRRVEGLEVWRGEKWEEGLPEGWAAGAHAAGTYAAAQFLRPEERWTHGWWWSAFRIGPIPFFFSSSSFTFSSIFHSLGFISFLVCAFFFFPCNVILPSVVLVYPLSLIFFSCLSFVFVALIQCFQFSPSIRVFYLHVICLTTYFRHTLHFYIFLFLKYSFCTCLSALLLLLFSYHLYFYHVLSFIFQYLVSSSHTLNLLLSSHVESTS